MFNLSDDETRKLAERMLSDYSSSVSGITCRTLAHKVKELLDRQRWIPVNERLPDSDRHIRMWGQLVEIYGPREFLGNYIDGEFIQDQGFHMFKVLYWRIPQPPEQQS